MVCSFEFQFYLLALLSVDRWILASILTG